MSAAIEGPSARTPVAVVLRGGYRAHHRGKRMRAQARAAARVVSPVSPTRFPSGPITHQPRGHLRRAGTALGFFAVALAVHVGGVGVALLIARVNLVPQEVVRPLRIEIRDLAPSPAAPLEAPVVSEPAPKPVVRPRMKKLSPPPDPTPATTAPTSAPPPPAVVGLSPDSTTASGLGPAFAAGNTRMGETGPVATAPDRIAPLPTATSLNRVATRPPASGLPVTKPVRKNVKPPPYPELLRQQGIEADVVVVVNIDIDGKVTRVLLAKGASYPELNQAAVVAAQAEVFEPARQDGKPIPYTLKYTYQFRLTED